MMKIKGEKENMNTKKMTIWFNIMSVILVLWGIVFAFFGLDVLPVINKDILLPWESALYGAIMMGWGVTLFMVGRIAFSRNDKELLNALLYGIVLWLVVEGLFSAFKRKKLMIIRKKNYLRSRYAHLHNR